MHYQQQNPPAVSHSLLQERVPSDDSSEPQDIKPFSIRQYVLAIRQKDTSHSWPFPEKYLQACLKRGISNVLPPFEPCDSAREQSLRECVKDECNLYFDQAISEASGQDCQLSLSSNSLKREENNDVSSVNVSEVNVQKVEPSATMTSSHLHINKNIEKLTSQKRLRHERRKCKGRPKKRSMADILAVAKRCTLEDLYNKINRLGCSSRKPPESGIEGSGDQMAYGEYNCKSKLTEKCSNKKLQRDNDEAADDNLLGKKWQVVKIKFSGCEYKSWNIF